MLYIYCSINKQVFMKLNTKNVKTKLLLYITTIAYSSCLSFSLFASGTSFKNYSVADGLVTKSVTGILQDKDGFIWIATTNGLSRFDGYEFCNFTSFTKGNGKLQGAFIFDITEGKDQTIWLSTDAGLEYYDKSSENFKLYLKGNMFKRKAVLSENGNLWLTDSIFDFIVYSKYKGKLHKKELNLPYEEEKPIVIYNFILHNNLIWLASNHGIASYNNRNNTFRWIEKSEHSSCSNIHTAGANKLIFTFPDEGVCTINTTGCEMSWISKAVIEEQIGTHTTLFDAVADKNNAMYVAISPGLLYIEDSIITHYNSSYDETSLEGNSFTSLCKDRNGNIWAGTIEHGIFFKKKDETGVTFATRLHKNDLNKTNISNFQLYDNGSLLYDDSKAVYLCSDYTALNKGCAKTLMKAAHLWSAALDPKHAIIYQSDTAFIYNTEDGTFYQSHFATAPACVCKDSSGVIWTGTWTGQLLGYDPSSKKHIEIEIEKGSNKQLVVFSIVCDPDGSLWLGTFGKGLVHVSGQTTQNPSFEFFNKDSNGDNFLDSDMILCLHIDPSDNLWVGTNGKGVVAYNRIDKSLNVFTSEHGLSSNIIESITSDKKGNIWIATNVVSKLNIKDQRLTHYLQPGKIKDSFIVKASAKSKNGHVLFASTKGLYIIDPSVLKENVDAPVPQLTAFKIRGITTNAGDTIDGIVPYQQSISISKEIALPYALNSFSVVFASVEYNDMKMINYQYRLKGADNNWVSADANNRAANYAGIQPGRYIFQVRASYGTKNWSQTKDLAIIVSPPWWGTIWFRSALILLLSTLVLYGFIISNRQKKQLEEKIKQRTTSLSKANKLLQENHQILEMKNGQLEEALQSKNKLIQVIAHDFKNPLWAMNGHLTLLKEKLQQYDKDIIIEMLNSATQASSQLQHQMTEVLEWALSEECEIKYQPAEINIEILINDSLELVRKSAEQKNIFISTCFEYNRTAFIDPRMISTVIRNLLTNAIKFTPQNGTIAIVAQEYENEIEVSVIDSGKGIDEQEMKQIFSADRKVTADTENTISSGIGLRLSKSFVENNKGELFARSQKDRGSVFSFTVPMGSNKAVKQTEIQAEKPVGFNKVPLPIKKDSATTILIIDDNIQILQLLKKLFENYYNLATATDGQSGMQMACNMLPALIISDISMPQTNGTDLCHTLKNEEITASIPIILITANDSLMAEGYASGADDFITKPFNEEELLLKAHSLLENRRRLFMQKNKGNSNSGFILPDSVDDIVTEKLLIFVNENFCDPQIDIQTIGENVGLGRTQLWLKFKSATGKTINEYIRDLRLSKAKEMLRSGKYKIAEVGYEVGFNNPQYFSKTFTKHIGVSPREFQNKMKQDK